MSPVQTCTSCGRGNLVGGLWARGERETEPVVYRCGWCGADVVAIDAPILPMDAPILPGRGREVDQ